MRSWSFLPGWAIAAQIQTGEVTVPVETLAFQPRVSMRPTLEVAVRAFLTLALVPATCAIAQAPEPTVTLRVNTQLVEVSVVVKDSHGNPVIDLKPGDFDLYDNGKKQEIRVFHLEDYRPVGTAQPPAAHTPAAPATLTDRTFTNRTPPEPGAPNAPTIILIDAGNTWDPLRMTWADLVFARDELIKFLRQVHSEDRLGIYLMGSKRFWVLHEYTESCADILERLASWKTTGTPDAVSPKGLDVWTQFAIHFAGVDAETAQAIHHAQFWTPNPMESSALPEQPADLPGVHQGMATDESLVPQAPTPAVGGFHAAPAADHGAYVSPEQSGPLAVLSAVADHLASVPGRKNVVLVSGKIFLPTEFQDQVKVLRTIIQDGVAVYAIDPGGLAPYAVDASYELSGMAKIRAMNNPRAAVEDVQQTFDTKRQLSLKLQSSLTELAEATGGRVFFGTNDIFGAIHSSFEDSRVTYTLGFYPNASSNEGSFHPLKVKIPGREHLSVRYRDGYFEPQPPQRDPHLREVEMRQAAFSPVDATAIELSGSVASVAAKNDCELKLNIGLAAVSLLPEGGHWNGQVEVGLFERDNSGNADEPVSQTLDLKLQQDSYDQALKGGLPFSRSFRLNPKATSLRVVVRDLSSGNTGTLTMPAPASTRVNLAAANPFEKELENLAASPNGGNIAASASVPFFYESSGVARVNMVLEIPPPVLDPTELNGKLQASMDVLGQAYKPSGDVAARFSETVKFDFDNRQQFDEFLQHPLRYEHQFEVAPGNYTFKLIFRSAKGGFGVVEMPLAVDLYDAGQLSLSAIALSRQVQPISQDAAQEETEAGRKPLVFRGNRITVAGSDLLSKTGTSEAYFEIYQPRATGAPPVQLTMRLRILDAQTADQKWDSGDINLSSLAQSANSVIPVALKLPVGTLPPGRYHAELTVKDSTGGQAARTVQFRTE